MSILAEKGTQPRARQGRGRQAIGVACGPAEAPGVAKRHARETTRGGNKRDRDRRRLRAGRTAVRGAEYLLTTIPTASRPATLSPDGNRAPETDIYQLHIGHIPETSR